MSCSLSNPGRSSPSKLHKTLDAKSTEFEKMWLIQGVIQGDTEVISDVGGKLEECGAPEG